MNVAPREAGFTLIEMVATLAIVALMAALAMPRWPQATSRPQVEALALRAAAVLKADRNAAVRLRAPVRTALNFSAREIVSGAGAGVVKIPADVGFDALVADACGGEAIAFLPGGMSCGGSIALARPGAAYRVRVNWLTGGVDVVETPSTR